MGLVRKGLSAVPTALAKVNRDSESGRAGGDVHWCTTCEIETTHDKGPTVGVPGPAGNGVVHERGPHEDEENDGAKVGTFSKAANSEHRRNGGEHELVDAVDDGGDPRAAD